MEKIFLLIGTNVGDLKSNLIKAQKHLEKHDIKIIKKSKIYKTKPWGNNNQPEFLNMALEIVCNYKPIGLLYILKKIESSMGRKMTERRWGPRIIDIDILFYGRQTIKRKDLIIPHREFYNRRFAVKILADIAPDFVPPQSDKQIKDYLEGVADEGFEIYCD
jgi:2-amino-4-hydroxy-6-hydroxymethyldihydropteridine diphosphokinase